MHQAIVKFKNSGIYSDAKRSGRPKKTTPRADNVMKRQVMKSPTRSAKKIRAELNKASVSVSRRTVSRRLVQEFGLKSRKPAKKPKLTAAMKTKRLQFALQHKDWTTAQWSKVLFSDESTIQQFAARKKNVRRPSGTRYDEKYTQQTIKHPPSVITWRAISIKGTAGLFFLQPGTTMNGQKYLNLMKEKLQLHMSVHECTIFMQDGAPCHRSKIVKEYFKEKKITLLQWPGNSPDLNPIENFWTVLKNKVSEKYPASISALIEAIKLVWIREMPKDLCKNLIESIPRRIKAVIKAHGGNTKY